MWTFSPTARERKGRRTSEPGPRPGGRCPVSSMAARHEEAIRSPWTGAQPPDAMPGRVGAWWALSLDCNLTAARRPSEPPRAILAGPGGRLALDLDLTVS